jgi:hypothetical protein
MEGGKAEIERRQISWDSLPQNENRTENLGLPADCDMDPPYSPKVLLPH